jgi:hypothetical protein
MMVRVKRYGRLVLDKTGIIKEYIPAETVKGELVVS